jgi:hypothetical protein
MVLLNDPNISNNLGGSYFPYWMCVREIWSNLFDGFGVPPSTHHLSLLQRKKCEIWEAKNHDAFMISATTQQPMQPHHLMCINRINHPLWESYNNWIIGLRVGCLHESNMSIECLTKSGMDHQRLWGWFLASQLRFSKTKHQFLRYILVYNHGSQNIWNNQITMYITGVLLMGSFMKKYVVSLIFKK